MSNKGTRRGGGFTARSRHGIILAALMAAGWVVTAGAGTALAAPPTNDNLAAATPITSLPFSDTVDTREATTESFETGACGLTTVFPKSVWYRFTPSTSATVVVSTAGSNYSVAGGVFAGPPSSSPAVSCFTSQGSFAAAAGQTYYIALVDFGGGAGGTLNLSVTAPQPPAPPTVAVGSTGTIGPQGESASVPVTYTCDPNTSTTVDVTLLQSSGKRLVRAAQTSFDPLVCDGASHTIAFSLENFGPFALKTGKATVTARIRSFPFVPPFDILSAQAGPQEIRLRK